MPAVKINGRNYEEVAARGGRAYRSVVTIARPANATPYTAGDVIGIADAGTPANAGSAVHSLTPIAPAGGFVIVQSIELLIALAAVPSGMSGFRLHFFSQPPSTSLDNAAFDLAVADRAGYAGYVDLPAPQDLGSTLHAQIDYTGRLIKLAAGSNTLYVELETRGAYTPTSGEVYELRVKTLEAGL